MGESEAAEVVLNLNPCSTCGRTFNPDSLARHEAICVKNSKSSSRRKAFDTRKQRLHGTELENFLPSRTTMQSETKYIMAAQKKANWRRKHEEFVNSIRSARNLTNPSSQGTSGAPPPPAAPNPDYVQCNYCQRRFEPSTAERHIPFCKEQANRLDRKSSVGGTKAIQSLNKRIGYKPPPLKKKSSECRSSEATPSKPPGSSVIMQNTNFKNTYVLDQTPPTAPSRPSPKQSSIPKNIYGGTSVATRNGRPIKKQSSNHTSSPAATQWKTNDTPTQKPKTTSFSRLRGDVPGTTNPAPSLDKGTNGTVVTPRTPNNLRGYGTASPRSKTITKRLDSPRVSAQQRLYAALEYSDQSSDDGGHVTNGYSSRSRQLTGHTTLDNNNDNRYEMSPSPRGITGYSGGGNNNIGGMVMPSLNDRDLPLITQTRTHKPGSAVSSGTPSPLLNEHGMPMSKYCYECGTKYPVPHAKYCCECGTKRI